MSEQYQRQFPSHHNSPFILANNQAFGASAIRNENGQGTLGSPGHSLSHSHSQSHHQIHLSQQVPHSSNSLPSFSVGAFGVPTALTPDLSGTASHNSHYTSQSYYSTNSTYSSASSHSTHEESKEQQEFPHYGLIATTPVTPSVAEMTLTSRGHFHSHSFCQSRTQTHSQSHTIPHPGHVFGSQIRRQNEMDGTNGGDYAFFCENATEKRGAGGFENGFGAHPQVKRMRFVSIFSSNQHSISLERAMTENRSGLTGFPLSSPSPSISDEMGDFPSVSDAKADFSASYSCENRDSNRATIASPSCSMGASGPIEDTPNYRGKALPKYHPEAAQVHEQRMMDQDAALDNFPGFFCSPFRTYRGYQ